MQAGRPKKCCFIVHPQPANPSKWLDIKDATTLYYYFMILFWFLFVVLWPISTSQVSSHKSRTSLTTFSKYQMFCISTQLFFSIIVQKYLVFKKSMSQVSECTSNRVKHRGELGKDEETWRFMNLAWDEDSILLFPKSSYAPNLCHQIAVETNVPNTDRIFRENWWETLLTTKSAKVCKNKFRIWKKKKKQYLT